MSSFPPEYLASVRLLGRVVVDFKRQRPGQPLPLFVMPTVDAMFAMSVADVGRRLARNDAARDLVKLIISESDRAKLNDYPTMFMMRYVFDFLGIPVKEVSDAQLVEELGADVTIVPITAPGDRS